MLLFQTLLLVKCSTDFVEILKPLQRTHVVYNIRLFAGAASLLSNYEIIMLMMLYTR